MDSGRLQPALLGGVFIGVMSALPIVNAGNCCCCLWVLAGGALAVYLRQQNSARSRSPRRKARWSACSPASSAASSASVLNIPIQMMMGPMQAEWMSQDRSAGNEDMPPEVREMIDRMAAGGALGAAGILMSLVNIVMSTIFGMLGGLLGVAIFKRNAPPPPPPARP